MAFDPFKDAAGQNDEAKRRLLDAVIQGGTEGRKSFEAAQSSVAQAQKEALARLQTTQINGGDPALEAKLAGRFGQHTSAIAGAQDMFNKGMEQTKTSGISYLEKLGATVPVLQAENKLKIDSREKEIQAAIAEAQRKAEAEAAQRQAQNDFQLQLAMLREAGDNSRANAAESGRNSRAQAAATAAAAKDQKALLNSVSLDQLAGVAKNQLDQRPAKLGIQIGGLIPKVTNTPQTATTQEIQELAANLGRNLGIPDIKLAGLYEPGYVQSLSRAIDSAASRKVPGNEQAQALADRLHINGGVDIVKQILGSKNVQDDLRDYRAQAVDPKNKKTFDQVKQELAKYYLTPNKKGNVQDRTYNILVELLGTMPWDRPGR